MTLYMVTGLFNVLSHLHTYKTFCNDVLRVLMLLCSPEYLNTFKALFDRLLIISNAHVWWIVLRVQFNNR